MKVVLRTAHAPDGTHYWALTVGKTYEVLGIEADSLRLMDDTSEPILFDPVYFDVIDPSEPGTWISELGSEGERYAYPPGWTFLERFFNGVPAAVASFWDRLRLDYPETYRQHVASRNL